MNRSVGRSVGRCAPALSPTAARSVYPNNGLQPRARARDAPRAECRALASRGEQCTSADAAGFSIAALVGARARAHVSADGNASPASCSRPTSSRCGLAFARRPTRADVPLRRRPASLTTRVRARRGWVGARRRSRARAAQRPSARAPNARRAAPRSSLHSQQFENARQVLRASGVARRRSDGDGRECANLWLALARTRLRGGCVYVLFLLIAFGARACVCLVVIRGGKLKASYDLNKLSPTGARVARRVSHRFD